MAYDRRPLLAGEETFDRLRPVAAKAMQHHPLHIDTVVALPDPLPAVWTLPDDDADFSTHWMSSKSGLTRGPRDLSTSFRGPRPGPKKREQVICQQRFWEHQIRDSEDYAAHLD